MSTEVIKKEVRRACGRKRLENDARNRGTPTCCLEGINRGKKDYNTKRKSAKNLGLLRTLEPGGMELWTDDMMLGGWGLVLSESQEWYVVCSKAEQWMPARWVPLFMSD